MDPQLPSSIKKWINIALKKLGTRYLLLTFILGIQAIILLGIVFYCSAQGLPALHIIAELEWQALLTILFLFTFLIFSFGAALMAPFMVYRSYYAYVSSEKFSSLSIKPYKILLMTFSFPYSIYFCASLRILIENSPKFISFIPLIIFSFIAYQIRKTFPQDERWNFCQKIISSNILLFLSLILYLLLFENLCSQIPNSWVNWEETPGKWLLWTSFNMFPLAITLMSYYLTRYSPEVRSRSAKEIYCFMVITGVLFAFSVWPGAGALMNQTFRNLKIGGGIEIEVDLDHVKACKYPSSFIKEDEKIIKQVCDHSYQGSYRLTLTNLYLAFGYKGDLIVYFDKPIKGKSNIIHTIGKEFKPNITYLPSLK